MTLDERKAFRREMLYQAIRQGMQSLEVPSSMYRFKIMNLDSRHHRFIAMIEVSTLFKARKGSTRQNLPQVEEFLRQCAFEYFGIRLESVFWRVSGSRKEFDRSVRAGDPQGAVTSTLTTSAHHSDDRSSEDVERLARLGSNVSAEERQAFMEALKNGKPLPPVNVGGRQYESVRTSLETALSNDDQSPSSGPQDLDSAQYGLHE